MLPHIVNQMRAGRLIKIGHPPSQQREPGVLKFRQIEREGDLALEPGLHRVSIGGNHIHRRRTGQGRHVQVCNLAENMISIGGVFFGPSFDIGRSQAPSHENDGCRSSHHPSQTETPLWFAGNALFYTPAEISAWSEAFSASLNCPLHLYARKGIRRTQRAGVHMSVEHAHLLLWELTVQVSV